MARIPMGDFGNVTARPGPAVNVDPEAYGAAVGRVAQHAGNVGMAIANDEFAQQAHEQKRQLLEQQTEAKAAAREANRVKALTTQATIQNGLADLHDEVDQGIASGTIPKEKAAEVYATRSQKLLDDGVQDVDPEHQGLVRASLLNDLGRGRASVNKLVAQRNKADILAGGVSYIEEMQRYAARGGKQADEAIANVRDFWTATGPMAGEDAAKASARVQQFAERVRYQQATSLVNVDPSAALKALKDNNYLPELDPQQRTALIQTADTRVTQAAHRAEIAAAANERKMEREWKAVSTVIEAGKALDPAYAADVMKRFRGTAYEKALGSLMAEGPANAAFAGQPLEMQRRSLEEMQGRMNREGATPAMVASYEKADKAFKAAQADIKTDPYMAAAERGVLKELSPLSMDMASLPGQLVKRSVDAAQVAQWVGSDVSLFRPSEAHKVGELLQAMPPKDRAGAMEGLAKVMNPGQMRAFAHQLGSKDDTLAAAAILSAQGAKTSAGRLVSELVLTGADAMKEQRIKWPSGMDPTTVRAEIDKRTRGAFLSESGNRAAGDAAFAVLAGLVAEGKSPDIDQAVRLATGGIMDRDGQKLVKPYGWSDGQVNDALRSFTPEKVGQLTGKQRATVGDKQLTDEELANLLPSARLGPTGKPGAYTVTIGGRMVMNASGRPLVLPLEGN